MSPCEALRESHRLEGTLARIWQEVLELPSVEPGDNFLRLGGQSLLASRICARIRTDLALDVPLRMLFETRSLADLARRLDSSPAADAETIVRASRSEALPLSYEQRQLWFVNRLEPRSATYNLALAVRLVGDLQVLALEVAFGEIVRRHESLRTTFIEEDGCRGRSCSLRGSRSRSSLPRASLPRSARHSSSVSKRTRRLARSTSSADRFALQAPPVGRA